MAHWIVIFEWVSTRHSSPLSTVMHLDQRRKSTSACITINIDVAWNCIRNAISRRNEICSSSMSSWSREEFHDGMFPMTIGFSRPKHSGEQRSHLQGGWFRSESRNQRRRELHHARWKNSYPLDSDRSDWLPQVHLGIGCVEFRCALLGSGFLRRATLLELVESRCDQIHQELLPSTTTDGLHCWETIGKYCCSSFSF